MAIFRISSTILSSQNHRNLQTRRNFASAHTLYITGGVLAASLGRGGRLGIGALSRQLPWTGQRFHRALHALCEEGLMRRINDTEVQIVDWSPHNPTEAQVARQREYWATRKRVQRAAEKGPMSTLCANELRVGSRVSDDVPVLTLRSYSGSSSSSLDSIQKLNSALDLKREVKFLTPNQVAQVHRVIGSPLPNPNRAEKELESLLHQCPEAELQIAIKAVQRLVKREGLKSPSTLWYYLVGTLLNRAKARAAGVLPSPNSEAARLANETTVQRASRRAAEEAEAVDMLDALRHRQAGIAKILAAVGT